MTAKEGYGAALVLSHSAILSPVATFPESVRSRLAGSDGDFVLSRARARTGSQRINAETAEFLKLFAEPRTIIEATIAHAERHGIDPAAILDETFALVLRFREQQILVDPDDAAGPPLGPRFETGALAFGLRVVSCTHALADTEIYHATDKVGQPVALKYVLPQAPGYVRAALANEDAVLRAAAGAGGFVARSLNAELERADPYIVMEWLDGETLDASLRAGGLAYDRRARVAAALLAAYQAIHAIGILHGDVHPGNVLITADARVHLVDFGGARIAGVAPLSRRLGQIASYEPEVAAAVRRVAAAPEPSEAGEQYAVAALIFQILTGSTPIRLALEAARSLDQIVAETPRTFDELGLSAPVTERVLARALAKEPRVRFPTFEAFAVALVQALEAERDWRTARATPRRAGNSTSHAHELDPTQLARQLHRRYGMASATARHGLREGPTASLYHGAAGLSLAFVRLAVSKSDPEALAAANVWLGHATSGLGREDGLVGPRIGLPASNVGPGSVMHGIPGVHLVGALVNHALAVAEPARTHFDSYLDLVAANAGPWSSQLFGDDLANGTTGLLHGLTTLKPVAQSFGADAEARWLSVGNDCAREVELRVTSGPEAPGGTRYLGFAHGTAGQLDALLSWSVAAGVGLSATAVSAVAQLADRAEIQKGRARWPLTVGASQPSSWSGWCHGSAGYVLLWIRAADVLRREDYLDLAQTAAEDVWATRDRASSSLCCGRAGQAIALAKLGRRTSLSSWDERAHQLASQALRAGARLTEGPGLFRGGVGRLLAAIEATSESPEFPICGAAL